MRCRTKSRWKRGTVVACPVDRERLPASVHQGGFPLAHASTGHASMRRFYGRFVPLETSYTPNSPFGPSTAALLGAVERPYTVPANGAVPLQHL